MSWVVGRELCVGRFLDSWCVALCTLAFCTLWHISLASAADFQGLALVTIHSKRVRLEIHQVISVVGERAVFAALDDFGGVPFVASFAGDRMSFLSTGGTVNAKGKKLKKILSLPLTQTEFLGILRHELPPGFSASSEGELEVWVKHGKKTRAIFSEFVASDKATAYPFHILVEDGKFFFEIRWQTLQPL